MAYTIEDIYDELDLRLDQQDYEIKLGDDEVIIYKNGIPASATVYFDNPPGRPQGIAIDFSVGQERTHGYYELQSSDFDDIITDIYDTLSHVSDSPVDPFERMKESTEVKSSVKFLQECGYTVKKAR